MALVPADELNRLRDGVKRFSRGFTPGQKAVVVVAFLGVVVGAVIFMRFSGQPSYAPLFTNLQASDAGAMTQKLSTEGVPYKLANGGSTIMVPQNDVYQQRLDMAEAGLPTSGTVGLSIMDKEGITSSQLAQQADYQRALQGELERTIDAIQGVTSSQVNLALPAQGAFALNTPAPTGASVLVNLQPGASLTGGQVQAVVHLVASAIPNLDPADVTVADSSGSLLAGPGVSNSVGTQNSATAAYETKEESKIGRFLATLIGPNNADVQVNAELNFNKVSSTTHSILTTPTGAPISTPVASSGTKETFNGVSTGVGGVLGSVTAPPGTTGPSTYTKSSTSNTYDVGTQTTTTVQSPGTLARQSVAVLVNSKALPSGTSLATLKSEVAAAAGIQPARGDVLSFAAMPFSSSQALAAKKAAQASAAAHRRAEILDAVRDVLLALAILVVLFLLWRSSRRSRIRSIPSSVQHQIYPLEMSPAGALVTTEMPALQMEKPKEPINADIKHFVESQPEDVAMLLRGWMEEQSAEPRKGA